MIDTSTDPFGTQTSEVVELHLDGDRRPGELRAPRSRCSCSTPPPASSRSVTASTAARCPTASATSSRRCTRPAAARPSLPAAGDTVPPQRSVPNLAGALVLSITSGADAETAGELVLRGPAELSSRGRAVAPGDYATLALGAEGVDIARAHCLPGRDPRSTGGVAPGVVGVIVVPRHARARRAADAVARGTARRRRRARARGRRRRRGGRGRRADLP